MKPSNKFRLTHTFAILSNTANDIRLIALKYGKTLVSVAHQNEPKGDRVSRHTYVLRIVENRNLIDLAVYVDSLDTVIETERVMVIEAAPQPDFTYTKGDLHARTDAARAWCRKNLLADVGYNGDKHFVDEAYIAPIMQKIEAAGLRFTFA